MSCSIICLQQSKSGILFSLQSQIVTSCFAPGIAENLAVLTWYLVWLFIKLISPESSGNLFVWMIYSVAFGGKGRDSERREGLCGCVIWDRMTRERHDTAHLPWHLHWFGDLMRRDKSWRNCLHEKLFVLGLDVAKSWEGNSSHRFCIDPHIAIATQDHNVVSGDDSSRCFVRHN